MTDEPTKQYRVLCWLDRLLAGQQRLAYLRDRLDELDAKADGLGAVTYRKDGVRVSYTPDKVGELVAKNEEARADALGEMDAIGETLRDARRILQDAWDANAGENDPACAYLMALYVDGVPEAEAARAVGMTTWGARLYPREVAAMIYDANAARFPETVEERFAVHGFGYWKFAKQLGE